MEDSILVMGDNNLTFSVVVCLLQAGHSVYLLTQNRTAAMERIGLHLDDLKDRNYPFDFKEDLKYFDGARIKKLFDIIVIVSGESLEKKVSFIRQSEHFARSNSIICVNTESILLNKLQSESSRPKKVIGVNWSEPAHTTFFLELLKNREVDDEVSNYIFKLSETRWKKKPYIVNDEIGVRSRIISACIREAFYLIDNEYATPEDIDRAFRNDAGHYLPFVGICRYMDLMGPYAYGKVMKELNSDLCKDKDVPPFFKEIIRNGFNGMKSGKGMFNYTKDEIEEWDKKVRKFSYDIRKIFEKYPFDYEE